jgi:hypothetical protein
MTAVGQLIADANLRASTSSDAKILQVIKKGLLVEITASSGPCYKVSFLVNDLEVVGWVNSSLVKLR